MKDSGCDFTYENRPTYYLTETGPAIVNMANEQHIKILKQGYEIWNLWRHDNPEIKPDLRGASLAGIDINHSDLSDADLSGADLSGASLVKADLIASDLSGANLNGAYLNQADLKEANLSNAILTNTDFRRAKLDDAILTNADLRESDFSGSSLRRAKLQGANFSNSEVFRADLTDADLSDANLTYTILRNSDLMDTKLVRADLTRAILNGAVLEGADLERCLLVEADLDGVDLNNANLSGADISNAKLRRASLNYADCVGANLRGVNLREASLVETNLENANLTGCLVYGISAWKLNLEGAKQSDLVITRYDEPIITVDNLEVAQFIYLLISNKRIRHVIDTLTSKVVLILGRFTAERKRVLDALRQELRQHDYLPVLFDFDKPNSRDITETISTLAHMARFVIADITDAKSIPQELMRIVPFLPSVPIQPLLFASDYEYGMFEHFKRYHWVLDTYVYNNSDELINALDHKIIAPAEAKAKELMQGSSH